MFAKAMVKKSRTKDKTASCQVIGVAGSTRGVGVTHFCILAAGYLSAFLKKKTAVLEWNSHGDFKRIEQICTGRIQKRKSCSILDILYCREAGARELVDCLENGYQYIIVDFGVYAKENQEEFLRCGMRVLIGSFSEWQEEEFLAYLKGKNRAERDWKLAAAFGSVQSRKEVKKKLGISVCSIPFAADAFTVTPEVIRFFREFFEN